MIRLFLGFVAVLAAGCLPGTAAAPAVRYEPSPPEVVRTMLELGDVRAADVVYDLGCGDGRIVIEAARRYGARGVCVDIDPARIAEARRNAHDAGVSERITFLNQDLFATELGGASVVMLFLSLDFNLKLRPKLQRDLKPGARIVSHWHGMGDWPPHTTVSIKSDSREREVFLWIVPAR